MKSRRRESVNLRRRQRVRWSHGDAVYGYGADGTSARATGKAARRRRLRAIYVGGVSTEAVAVCGGEAAGRWKSRERKAAKGRKCIEWYPAVHSMNVTQVYSGQTVVESTELASGNGAQCR